MFSARSGRTSSEPILFSCYWQIRGHMLCANDLYTRILVYLPLKVYKPLVSRSHERKEFQPMRRTLSLLLLLFTLCVFPVCAPAAHSPETSTSSQGDRGNPSVKVWVNIPTHVYHCPGTRWYGTTKQGTYMTQKEAQDKGNRPAYGNYCQ
jgi:hypothetical protein